MGALGLAAALAIGCAESEPASLSSPVHAPVHAAAHAAGPSAERTRFLAEVRALVASEDWEGAHTALAARAAQEGEDGEVLSLLSLVARMRGDVEGALDFGERATSAAPDSSDAHLQYCRALGQKMQRGGMLAAMGSLGDFRDALDRARELDPANLDARGDEIAFHLIAPGIAGGDREQGLELARELTALDRERGLPLYVWALSANDETELALATARAALEEDPGNRQLRLSLARLCAEEELLDEAFALWEALLEGERDRHHYEALYQLARARIQAEREPERALEALQQYVAGAPAAPELPPKAGAWWRIGQAHELLDDLDAARAAYETALSLDPDFEQASDALDALD